MDNSLARSTKSTPSVSLRLLVGTRFQVLFHSPPGVLFTFPSRYFSLSVTGIVFSLGRRSSRLPAGFLVSRGTLNRRVLSPEPSPTRLSRSAAAVSAAFSFFSGASSGLFPVRSPLLRESLLLSLPPVTKMFQFAGFPPRCLLPFNSG